MVTQATPIGLYGERGYYVLTDAQDTIYNPNKHLTWKKCKSNTERCQFGSAYFLSADFRV